jgi:transposase
MRGEDVTQGALFSYVNLEDRVPQTHPLRRMRLLVDGILASLSDEFAARYAHTGRPSVAPEKLLRALLLQVLYTIRSERQLVEQLDYNLLFRWFVGLGLDDPVWDRTVFCANRDRRLSEALAREFFDRVRHIAEWQDLVSDEHFSVDGTLIEAWASHKSFVRKAGGGPDRPAGRNPEVDFTGEKRSNATHQSTTDPESRLYKKGEYTEAKLRYMAHVLAENRHGLIGDVETTQATGTAEVEAAERMVERNVPGGATIGADKASDQENFVAGLLQRGVKPHLACQKTGSAADGRTVRGKGYAVSLRRRKRVEESLAGSRPWAGCARPGTKGWPRCLGKRCCALPPTT